MRHLIEQQGRIAQGHQVDESRPVEAASDGPRDLYREARLAHSRGTREGEQPHVPTRKPRPGLTQVPFPPHQRVSRHRQPPPFKLTPAE